MLLVCLRPWRLTTASVAGLGVRTGARRAGGGGITTSGVVDTVEGGGVVDTVGDGGVVGRLSASLLLKMLLSRAAAAIIGISGFESVGEWRAGVRCCVARDNDDVTNDGVGGIVSGSGRWCPVQVRDICLDKRRKNRFIVLNGNPMHITDLSNQ